MTLILGTAYFVQFMSGLSAARDNRLIRVIVCFMPTLLLMSSVLQATTDSRRPAVCSGEECILLLPGSVRQIAHGHWNGTADAMSNAELKLSGDAEVLGIRLNSGRIKIHDQATAEVNAASQKTCNPVREAVPDNADVILYSGQLVWNGCGKVYWPEQLTPEWRNKSWYLNTLKYSLERKQIPAMSNNITTPENNTGNTLPIEDRIIIGTGFGLLVFVVTIVTAVLSCKQRKDHSSLFQV